MQRWVKQPLSIQGEWQPTPVFCLKNPMDRGAWRATVHRVTKSWTRQHEQANKASSQDPSLSQDGDKNNHLLWFCSFLLSVIYWLIYCCYLVTKSCLFCNPMDCSPTGSSVHGISQAGILEWVAIPFSSGSSRPRDQTLVLCTGRRILYHWAKQVYCLFNYKKERMPFVQHIWT